jgi:two-component system, sensor histidine kinase RegB
LTTASAETAFGHGVGTDGVELDFRWLMALRWAAVVGQTLAVVVVDGFYRIALPLEPIVGVLVAEVFVNLAALRVSRTRTTPTDFEVAAWVTADLTAFTALLYLSGGPSNPFSYFYILHVAMAALTLSPVYTWALVLGSAASYASLFAWHLPLGPVGTTQFTREQVFQHGAWAAYALGASCIAYFLHRVRAALRLREQLLLEQRELRVQAERLSSLATLAAGAAHELANPLSTIAVVSKELEHELGHLLGNDASRTAIADVALMRSQVERCRKILGRMAHTAGQAPGEAEDWLTLRQLLEGAVAELPNANRVELHVSPELDLAELYCPKEALAQALRVLIDNALDASETPVLVAAELAEHFTIRVVDQGRGMPKDVLQRAQEPFFTTKPAGKGMGLGLFLARNVVSRLDGELRLQSRLDKGTTAEVLLPRKRIRVPPAANGRAADPA